MHLKYWSEKMKKLLMTGATRVAAAALAVSFFVPAPGLAWMKEVGIERIAGQSDTVVRGDVIDRRSYWSFDGSGRIVTDVDISVSEVVAGRVPQRSAVTVEVLGGEIPEENLGLRVSDQPAFEVGEQVVLFLRENPGRGSYTTVAGRQGKMKVEDGKVVVRGRPADLPSFRSTVRDLPVGSGAGR